MILLYPNKIKGYDNTRNEECFILHNHFLSKNRKAFLLFVTHQFMCFTESNFGKVFHSFVQMPTVTS